MTLKERLMQKRSELSDALKNTEEIIGNAEVEQSVKDEALDKVDAIQKEIDELAKLVDIENKNEDNEDPAGEEPTGSSASGDENRSSESEEETRDMEVKEKRSGMPVKGSEAKIDEHNVSVEEKRSALNGYIHSQVDNRSADGITSTKVGVLIPEEILYDPKREVKTVTNLKAKVTVTPVTTGKGSFPIAQKVGQRMATTAELAANPELNDPEFNDVDWSVETRRGFIPVSEESIADAQIDLVGFVAEQINQIATNTYNYDIATKLKTFTAKNLTWDNLIDQIKDIKNVALDPAYNKEIIVSQSLFNVLDKEKDLEGRYLLQDNVTADSGKMLLGLPVTVVEDTILGNEDDMKMWIGDLYRAILFADRAETTVRWIDNDTYGQRLQAALRYDVEVADEAAGYFATLPEPAQV